LFYTYIYIHTEIYSIWQKKSVGCFSILHPAVVILDNFHMLKEKKLKVKNLIVPKE